MSERNAFSRRIALLGGVGLALGATACTTTTRTSAPSTMTSASPIGATPQPSLTQSVTVERIYSAARGRDVDLVLTAPEGVSTAGLPVCLALHGRGSSARMFTDLGLPAMLTEAVKAGVPPFVVAAVDGDHYWVAVDSVDDPQKMLNDEVPQWLFRRNLRPDPVAAFGISMGGFGALRYARANPKIRAVAGISPALFSNWEAAKARKVFTHHSQWESNEPFRHLNEMQRVPVGIWCGSSDPFVKAARSYAQRLPAKKKRFLSGAHNAKYWKQVLPDVLKFVGEYIN